MSFDIVESIISRYDGHNPISIQEIESDHKQLSEIVKRFVDAYTEHVDQHFVRDVKHLHEACQKIQAQVKKTLASQTRQPVRLLELKKSIDKNHAKTHQLFTKINASLSARQEREVKWSREKLEDQGKSEIPKMLKAIKIMRKHQEMISKAYKEILELEDALAPHRYRIEILRPGDQPLWAKWLKLGRDSNGRVDKAGRTLKDVIKAQPGIEEANKLKKSLKPLLKEIEEVNKILDAMGIENDLEFQLKKLSSDPELTLKDKEMRGIDAGTWGEIIAKLHKKDELIDKKYQKGILNTEQYWKLKREVKWDIIVASNKEQFFNFRKRFTNGRPLPDDIALKTLKEEEIIGPEDKEKAFRIILDKLMMSPQLKEIRENFMAKVSERGEATSDLIHEYLKEVKDSLKLRGLSALGPKQSPSAHIVEEIVREYLEKELTELEPVLKEKDTSFKMDKDKLLASF